MFPRLMRSIVVGACSSVVICELVACQEVPPQTGSQMDEKTWLLILSRTGVMDPDEGKVDVKVYAIEGKSERDSSAVLQNVIRVTTAAGERTFRWSNSVDFVAKDCRIEDVDADGRPEFVFRDQGTTVRIVSYRKGKFSYREGPGRGSDELVSGRPMEVIDLDKDGGLDFVRFEPVSTNPLEVAATFVPRVYQWTTQSGFRDAPSTVANLYRAR